MQLDAAVHWALNVFRHKMCKFSHSFLHRMPLWSSWTGLICLRACLKMIQRQRCYTVCLEWLLFFKHILCCLCFLIHADMLIIIWGEILLEFLNPTLTFEQQTVELCMQLFEMGLAEHKRREAEVSSFFGGQMNAVTDSQQRASQILAKFEQQHKEVSCEGHNVCSANLNR